MFHRQIDWINTLEVNIRQYNQDTEARMWTGALHIYFPTMEVNGNIYFPTMEVNGTRNCLVTDILLNILFSVQQKKFIQFWKNRRVSILWQNIHF